MIKITIPEVKKCLALAKVVRTELVQLVDIVGDVDALEYVTPTLNKQADRISVLSQKYFDLILKTRPYFASGIAAKTDVQKFNKFITKAQELKKYAKDLNYKTFDLAHEGKYRDDEVINGGEVTDFEIN